MRSLCTIVAGLAGRTGLTSVSPRGSASFAATRCNQREQLRYRGAWGQHGSGWKLEHILGNLIVDVLLPHCLRPCLPICAVRRQANLTQEAGADPSKWLCSSTWSRSLHVDHRQCAAFLCLLSCAFAQYRGARVQI